MAELILRKSGVGMESGTMVEWRVADGDTVQAGDIVCVVETEKVDLELEAPTGGVIRLCAEEGIEYPVGAVLAIIGEQE